MQLVPVSGANLHQMEKTQCLQHMIWAVNEIRIGSELQVRRPISIVWFDTTVIFLNHYWTWYCVFHLKVFPINYSKNIKFACLGLSAETRMP